jgi:hypothetical protein
MAAIGMIFGAVFEVIWPDWSPGANIERAWRVQDARAIGAVPCPDAP